MISNPSSRGKLFKSIPYRVGSDEFEQIHTRNLVVFRYKIGGKFALSKFLHRSQRTSAQDPLLRRGLFRLFGGLVDCEQLLFFFGIVERAIPISLAASGEAARNWRAQARGKLK